MPVLRAGARHSRADYDEMEQPCQQAQHCRRGGNGPPSQCQPRQQASACRTWWATPDLHTFRSIAHSRSQAPTVKSFQVQESCSRRPCNGFRVTKLTQPLQRCDPWTLRSPPHTAKPTVPGRDVDRCKLLSSGLHHALADHKQHLSLLLSRKGRVQSTKADGALIPDATVLHHPTG